MVTVGVSSANGRCLIWKLNEHHGAKFTSRIMKKSTIATLLVLSAVVGTAIATLYFLPLLTRDNSGAAQVVLMHGLGRSEAAMLLMENHLLGAGYDVFNIGYPSNAADPQTLQALITDAVDECCANNGRPLHFVGHSLGGLLIRAYLADRAPNNLGKVVLLGPPNKGSQLADREDGLTEILVDFAGPTAQMLGTGPGDFPATLEPPFFPLGIIAGNVSNPASNQWLEEPNDGMVTVESAKLDGMTDFIELKLTHWGLRNSDEVFQQVTYFLQNNRFDR